MKCLSSEKIGFDYSFLNDINVFLSRDLFLSREDFICPILSKKVITMRRSRAKNFSIGFSVYKLSISFR